jgi:hypothetical protein
MSLETGPKQRTSPWELAVAPPPERWDDWVELDPTAWPERREKHYALLPTAPATREASDRARRAALS